LKTLSAVGLLMMVVGALGLLRMHSLFFPSPLVIGLQTLAVGLMLWARLTLGLRSFHATANPTGGGLVTSGPYRFVRHPIYTAIVLFVFAGAFAHPSFASAGLAALVFAGALGRMLLEERFLLGRYPGYAAYASRTRRMLPFVF
jgi:protein-S-isoprenylcysteine O-methyltransferase Ste14